MSLSTKWKQSVVDKKHKRFLLSHWNKLFLLKFHVKFVGCFNKKTKNKKKTQKNHSVIGELVEFFNIVEDLSQYSLNLEKTHLKKAKDPLM